MAVYPDKTRMKPYEPYLAQCSTRARHAVLREVGYHRYPFPVTHFLEQLRLPDGGDVQRIRCVGPVLIRELQAVALAVIPPRLCEVCGVPLNRRKRYCYTCAMRNVPRVAVAIDRKQVINQLLIDGMSLSDIARRFSISPQRVGQIVRANGFLHRVLRCALCGKRSKDGATHDYCRAKANNREQLRSQRNTALQLLQSGMTQTAVARRLGMSQTWVSKVHRHSLAERVKE